MLSKNKIKLIKSLEFKKYRDIENLFIVEGDKLAEELFNAPEYKILTLIATNEWIIKNRKIEKYFPKDIITISKEEMNKISMLSAPQEVLCLIEIPKPRDQVIDYKNKLTLVLDRIQDPGNFGTIIRICDWFGIDTIICSPDTVDVYNPKVIQSTMGAIFRVNIKYTALDLFLKSVQSSNIPVYGASLDGENIYGTNLTETGVIVMGNESKGIDNSLIPYIHKKIFIPFYPKDQKHSESLNVGVATAIICAEFRRRQMF